MINYKKYLKYKSKYLKINNMYGGNNTNSNTNSNNIININDFCSLLTESKFNIFSQ